MRTLITGARGMLGQALLRALPAAETLGFSSRELNVTDPNGVRRIFQEHSPEIVIHTAALTDVDSCELQPELAFAVNALGTRNVAQAAEEAGAVLVYISTDYVFDGNKEGAYIESDRPDPINVYGKSKLAGEMFTREHCLRHYIVRTSWLFGKNGRNFVRTILHLIGERPRLEVVSDQIGCPTYSHHLAQKIPQIAPSRAFGTYHVTNSGSCSWFQFAQEILRRRNSQVVLDPIDSARCGRPALRPHNSVLRNLALERAGLGLLPPWQDGLAQYLAELP